MLCFFLSMWTSNPPGNFDCRTWPGGSSPRRPRWGGPAASWGHWSPPASTSASPRPLTSPASAVAQRAESSAQRGQRPPSGYWGWQRRTRRWRTPARPGHGDPRSGHAQAAPGRRGTRWRAARPRRRPPRGWCWSSCAGGWRSQSAGSEHCAVWRTRLQWGNCHNNPVNIHSPFCSVSIKSGLFSIVKCDIQINSQWRIELRNIWYEMKPEKHFWLDPFITRQLQCFIGKMILWWYPTL